MGSLLRFRKKRSLASNAADSPYSKSTSAKRLNFIAKNFDFARYLEIGVESGQTLEAVDMGYRCGVDPKPLFKSNVLPAGVNFFQMSSDEFFNQYKGEPFQLIFLDGLHEAKQTYRDFINAFNILDTAGYVLLDDIWPSDFPSSLSDKNLSEKEKIRAGLNHRRWYGDVYKVLASIELFHPEIKSLVVGDGQEAHSQALLWHNHKSKKVEISKDAERYFETITYKEIFAPNVIRKPWSNWISEDVFMRTPHFFKLN